MTRLPLALALLGAALVCAVAWLSPSPLFPPWMPVAVAGAGAAVALAGAATGRTRVHVAGVAVAAAGAALTGIGTGWPLIAAGAFGLVLLVASVGLAGSLPPGGAYGRLAPVTLAFALVAAGVGTAVALAVGALGGGGLDARGGVTAWLVIAVALTWAIARRTLGGRTP